MTTGRSDGEIVHKQTQDAEILEACVVAEHAGISDGLLEAPFVDELGYNLYESTLAP